MSGERTRFTANEPCPICGGHQRMERGCGERCFGYLWQNGEAAVCTREEHAGALQLYGDTGGYLHALVGDCECGRRHDPHPPSANGHSSNGRKAVIVARYDYRDAAGALRFQVVRLAPKGFRQRRPDSVGGWIWNIKGVERVLYRLPGVLAADPAEPVVVVEGEKDADRLAGLGFVATTSPMGAGKWRKSYAEVLRGRDVVIIGDNDDEGRGHATAVVHSVQGVAKSVRVVELDGLREHGDVSDWLDAGHTAEELRERIADATRRNDGAAEETADRCGERSDPRPWIPVANADLPWASAAAWEALQKTNDPVRLFRFGGQVARLARDDEGVLRVCTLDDKALRGELARASRWYKETQEGRVIVLPPSHVIHDLLATAHVPLPVLRRVVEVPVFAPDGSLQTAPGYHPATGVYYAPAEGLAITAVPEVPTAQDVVRASRLIRRELLSDFPFVSRADRAHAIAALLLPFVRDIIDGPTPAHLIEAPSAGTGKGLLAHALVMPALGSTLSVMPPATSDDEWRKRLTALLREAPGAVMIDNLTRALDSASLSAALTARTWSDRLLGHSTTVKVVVRCLWLMVGNNPTMTTEIARRMVRIRMDARVDRPWQRPAKAFRHPKLLEWAQESRAELVWSALVLVRNWMAAGRPLGSTTLGSYERWASVMGGILRAAGIPGFLGNLDALYDEADTEGAMWRELVDAWWDKYRDGEVGVADLFALAQESERFEFGRATTERGQKTAFGMALSKQRDRIIGRFQVKRAGTQRRAALWRLAEVSKRVNLENQDEPFAVHSKILERHDGRPEPAQNSSGPEKVHVGSQGSHHGIARACVACGEDAGVDGRLCADCAADLEAAWRTAPAAPGGQT